MVKSGREGQDRALRSWPGPSYDAIYMLASAFERAKTVEPDAVVKALEQTDMQGAIGRIRFGKDHQVVYGFDPKETALGLVFNG